MADNVANVFLAVRKRGDEVQLSSMLAHLLTHTPARRAFEHFAELPSSTCAPRIQVEEVHDAGRCDLYLECDEYVAVIENKIFAQFQPLQVERYLDHLAVVRGDRVARVCTLTPLPERYPLRDGWDASQLVERTWSAFADLIRTTQSESAHEAQIMKEFVEMTDAENLSAPPLDSGALQAWNDGFAAFRWAYGLLDATRIDVAQRHEGLGSSKPLSISKRPNILTWFDTPLAKIGMGFQLEEANLFVVAYPRKGTARAWRDETSGVDRLLVHSDWTWKKHGAESMLPLRDVLNADDQRAFAGAWIEQRVVELETSSLIAGPANG